MIIGLCGLAGSGKDTAADFLVKKSGYVKVAFADPLKRICKEVFQFSDEQLWGPSAARNGPDTRYPRTNHYIYPAAPSGSLWYPIGGGHTLISETDLEAVSEYKWCVNKKEAGKKTSYVRMPDDSRKLHQFLLGPAPEGHVIDHINGDGLDNRRENLRFCTHGENHANEGKRVGGTSAFKGVGFDASREKWHAKITIAGETKNLGRFDTEVAAAWAYDKAAIAAFGPYARTNSQMFLTPRYALQQLGTNWGRDCYPNIWVEYALRTAKILLESTYEDSKVKGYHPLYYSARGGIWEGQNPRHVRGVVISDVRFENEVRCIKEAGGKVFCLRRGSGLAGEAGQHKSEQELQNIPEKYFEGIIDNREWSLEQLEDRMNRIAEEYGA